VTPEEILEGWEVSAVSTAGGRGHDVSSPDTGNGYLGLLDVVDAGNLVKASKGLIDAVVIVGRDPVLGVLAVRFNKLPVGSSTPISWHNC
jgi:hypothetical protein